MLPIRKVILFKHGVGYFEREGEIDGDASIDLHFRASEMNDVLKSLTVLDLQGGLVSSISYESTKPVDKQLEDIAIRIPDQNSLTGLLSQLKGARVAVVEAGQSRVEGVVAGIETRTRKAGATTSWDTLLTLLVEGAALRTFDVLELRSVTFLEESLRKDLQHLLDILISAKKKDLKKLTIFAKGQGPRTVQASYVVETPVWKTSYRVLLEDEAPLIQGWALVDNTQDEDWENVALSLVAGLPISFVHDLYSPRYKRRPVVDVKEEEAYAPPMLESADEAYEPEPMAPPPAFAMPAPAPMRAAMAGPPMPQAPGAPPRGQAMRASVQVQTRTAEVGDQFHYAIRNPVTVRRNQSALVPILQGSFEGKRVAVYNQEVRDKNPMSSVLFKNTTGMTLEGGPMTVFEADTYVGESMLETMKPGEERIVPFSVELGCQVTIDAKSETRNVHYVRISNGTLHLHRYRIQRQIYVIRNKTPRPIDLFLDHRFVRGWELVDTDKPVEKTESYYRFRLTVPAEQTTRYTVTEKGDQVESYGLSEVRQDQIRLWAESQYVDPEATAVLEALARQSEQIADIDRKIAEREQEIKDMFLNQERLRKNLQALGSSHDEKGLRERYVAELSAEEDKHQQLRSEIAGLKRQKTAAESELRAKVRSIKFEKLLG